MLHSLAIGYKMIKGAVGYIRFPEQKSSWGGPFNGQRHRLTIFHELSEIYRFKTIVETGTYRGTTTQFFASLRHARVYTIEADAWNYGYCRARFSLNRHVNLLWGDSRASLHRLAQSGYLASPPFFYLDAHWTDDLPLAEELEIIFTNWPDAAVMIDDFKVEGDARYEFDDYGDGQRLCIEYILTIINKFKTAVYFPSMEGENET